MPDVCTHAPSEFVKDRAVRRPVGFVLAVVFSIWAPVMSVPVLAHFGVLPGGPMPIELFALGLTVLVMLPAVLWVSAAIDGEAGVRALLARAFRWRFPLRWWLVVLLALPVCTTAVGLAMGGRVEWAVALETVGERVVPLLVALLVINLWEEVFWAGFVQAHLERTYGLMAAAALTAVPFTAIHLPLVAVDVDSVGSLLVNMFLLLLFAVVLRSFIGICKSGARDSVLAIGLFHAVLNECSNPGLLGDLLLGGVNQNYAAVAALVFLTVVLAALTRFRSVAKPSDAVPA